MRLKSAHNYGIVCCRACACVCEIDRVCVHVIALCVWPCVFILCQVCADPLLFDAEVGHPRERLRRHGAQLTRHTSHVSEREGEPVRACMRG